MEQRIEADLVFEMLGKPKEHIEKTMKELVEIIEKKVKIKKKKIHEAKEVEKSVFSTFSEVTIEGKFSDLIDIIFEFTPSSVEITKPSALSFKLHDINSFLNDICARLHEYAFVAKKLKMQRDILRRILEEKNKK